MKRKSLVVGNWKMNIMPSQAYQLCEQIKRKTNSLSTKVVIAPPYTHLPLITSLKNAHFSIGAQNVNAAESGAFTGGISVLMLKDLDVEYVIIGHSERRQAYISEFDLIAKKISICLKAGLKSIYCCGEDKSTREEGKEYDYVASQLEHDFRDIKNWNPKNLIIAYEPIWAIGTGLTASSEQTDQMHAFIRNWIKDKFSEKDAQETTILYGGSVKSSNSDELASKENIDGALVGGASLIVDEFVAIASSWG